MKRCGNCASGQARPERTPRTFSCLLAWAITAIQISALFIMLATTAWAQMNAPTQCGSRARIIAVLAGKYGEAPKAIGIISAQLFLEVHVSDAGSWTILMTNANNYSCIIAAGSDWEDLPFEPGARS